MNKLQEKLTALRVKQEQERAKRLAERLNLPFLDLRITPIETSALILIPKEKAKKINLAVIQQKDKQLFVAARNPESAAAKKVLSDFKKEGYQIRLFVTSLHGLEKVWEAYKEIPERPKEEITGTITIEASVLSDLKKKISSTADIKKQIDKIPIAQASLIVEVLLAGGLQTNASDVHLEASKENTIVRYRIDGLLQDVVFLSQKTYDYILNRLKLLAGMKLNVRDQAQDGRFTIAIDSTDIEVRVSNIPSAYGENIVMRILNPKAINLQLKDLGLRQDLLASIQREVQRPNGMIVTTGPTGSGKTTLLYSLIKTVNNPEVKIITLEDPIEYHLKGITQTQVETERGYTFASGLRAILRQDPDIVLVGEIRDQETAEIAIQAALTGHLVLSTLHTNDAAGAIPRFLDIGVNASSLASALNTIIAQRLVRQLCPQCKKAIALSEKQLMKIKEALRGISVPYPPLTSDLKIFTAQGCSKCNQTGYKGRVGIFEMIFVNESMERLINSTPGHIEILEKARQQGMVSFYQDGILKVLDGITTLEEIERIAGE